MGIFLNKKISNFEKNKFDNNLKTYSGFFSSYFELKTIDINSDTNSTSFRNITFNPINGFIIAISNVVVGSGNNILTSDNGGETWNSYKINEITTYNFNEIIYANGKYVAIGNNGINGIVIYSNAAKPTSSDWTIITTGNETINSNIWNSIIYGNGYYIGISETGTNRVITSKNAITWNSITIDVPKSWKGLVYNPILKRFLALATDTILYSEYNGESWNSLNVSVPSGNWHTGTWSTKNNKFIVIANGGNNRMISSESGLIWTTITDSLINSLTLNDIIWVQELEIFILITSDGKIITSTDGNKWTLRHSLSSPGFFQKIIWNSYYGNLIIISSINTSSKIIMNKSLGINSLLPGNKYFYELDRSFLYPNSDISLKAGTNILIYPNLSENLGYTYTTGNSLPEGILLNQNTGEISGSSIVVTNRTKYEIIAKNSLETLKTYIYLTITDALFGLSDFYYNFENSYTFLVNSRINIIPKVKGSYPFTFTISPSLPNTITLNKNTGVISGITPSTYFSTDYTITATNEVGSIKNIVNITINDIVPSDFNYNSGGVANPLVNTSVEYYPSSNSGTNVKYAITSPVSPLLNIDENTGRIYGTTTLTSSTITYAIKAYNSNGSQFKISLFTVNVKDVMINSFYYLSPSESSDLIENINFGIFNKTPIKDAGTNVSWSIFPPLIPGISIDNNTGTISGSSISPIRSSNYFYRRKHTVTASNSSTSGVERAIIISNVYQPTITTATIRDPDFRNYYIRGYSKGYVGSISQAFFNEYEMIEFSVNTPFGLNNPILKINFKKIDDKSFELSSLNINSFIITVNNQTHTYYTDDNRVITGSYQNTRYWQWTTTSGFSMPFPVIDAGPFLNGTFISPSLNIIIKVIQNTI